jgi:hypothetical protein
MWDERKRANKCIATDYAARSPVMRLLGTMDFDSEWRAIVALNTKTLVSDGDAIRREGPVVLGIRYLERHLGEAPHPMELVTVLAPQGVFHPNIADSNAVCLGHPAAGIPLDAIFHQVWAAFTFNMRAVNTRPGEIVNPAAAVYVRANAHQFPITLRGLFERPDEDLINNHWHILFDPRLHADVAQSFIESTRGANE